MTLEVRYLHGLKSPKEIESWLEEKETRAAVVLEENPAAFFSPQGHSRLHLRFVPYKAWDSVLEACAADFPYDHVECKDLPPHIRLKILRKTAVWHARYSEALYSPLFYRNILLNFPLLPRTFAVNRWRGAFKKTPAIICGAGPSLESAIPMLKQSGALIFAGGSTLSALSHFDVRPHFGLVIDPNDREYDAIRGCKYKDIPLLYCNRALPKIFDHFTGPYGYIRSTTGGTIENYLEEKLGLQDEIIGPELGSEAMSVTTMAIALACAFGCDPIILAGIDLAFTGGKRYAKGVHTPTDPQNSPGEHGLSQKGVKTQVKWVMESEVISNFAKARPDRTWINATGKGLGFKHIPVLPVSFSKKISPQKKIDSLIEKTTQKNLPSLAPIYASLRSSLLRCQKLCQEILKEEKDSGRAIVLEMDISEEPAFTALLQVAAFAFDHILHRDFKEKWTYLQECIRTHLESFKLVS